MNVNYEIAIGTLGIGIADLLAGVPEWHWFSPNDMSLSRLDFNMNNLYAWNISGNYGFESDGPCVFINYGESQC